MLKQKIAEIIWEKDTSNYEARLKVADQILKAVLEVVPKKVPNEQVSEYSSGRNSVIDQINKELE